MPVYEFYCADCHIVFNFLSRRVNVDKRPPCPKCRRPELERQVSLFAVSRGRKEETPEGMPDIDEEKMETAIMGLAGEMEGMDENNPRQMAHFLKRLKDVTGMNLGSGMDEVIRRLESGDDPDRIESEIGELLDGENPFSLEGIRGIRRRGTPPVHDETLYLL